MIQLITNLIVVTALVGALAVVVLVVVKALISLAAIESLKSDVPVVSQKVCKYCGARLAENDLKCQTCGAVRQ
jgi:hypothetical protein